MSPDFAARLSRLAEVVVRIGLNLQPGQPLLITDPYDLQGVHPEAIPLADAIASTASHLETERPRPDPEILRADPVRLKTLLERDDLPAYEILVSTHTRRLQRHLAKGGAFLFLTGSSPGLMAGIPADRLARFDAVKWRHLGPVIQSLIRGASQWTLAPAPTGDWAAAAATDRASLWETVFTALRIGDAGSKSLAEWKLHLTALAWQRDQLDAVRHRSIRYVGPGTDLTLELPRTHRWCTTQLTTSHGVAFVANLPIEEIFTAPHKRSASGTVHVAHPVTHAGNVIDGIELEFRSGRVVRASARAGEDLLLRLLATDDGANRLGEVALVPGRNRLPWAGRCHHHILLDENASPHVALGDAYRFCSRAWLPLAINSSQVHLDLPLDAEVELK